MLTLVFGLLFSPADFLPDSTEVLLSNATEGDTLCAMHFLESGSELLSSVEIDTLPPGRSCAVSLHFTLYERMILVSTAGRLYKVYDYVPPLPGSGDSLLRISRADREFGGIFDVIVGSRPHILYNNTQVPIYELSLMEDSSFSENLLSGNPVMPQELVYLWLDEGPHEVRVTDSEGNLSRTITTSCGGGQTTQIRIDDFLADSYPGQPVRLVNCINGVQIREIEIYGFDPRDDVFLDLSDDPLELWGSVQLPLQRGISHVICYDSLERSFSADYLDPDYNAFIVDWWNLDFDFEFPKDGE